MQDLGRMSRLVMVGVVIAVSATAVALGTLGISRWTSAVGANGGTPAASVTRDDGLVMADRAVAEHLCACGCDVLCGPIAVTVCCPKETLPIVGEFSQVPALIFFGQTLGEEAAILSRLNKLEYLSFRRCSFVDGSLAFLDEAHDLKTLILASSSITDSDLEHLRPSFSLDKLDVSYNHELTHQGVQALSQRTPLSELTVACTSVSDLGFVANNVRLQSLDLSETPIDDDDLEALVALPRLNTLRLSDTSITDGAIRWIIQMKALRRLEVERTELSENGIEKLKEAIFEVMWK